MINDRDRKGIANALYQSTQSTFGRVKIGAVVSDNRGNNLGSGHNQRRTHPRQYAANKRAGKQIENPCLHAELSAILDAEDFCNEERWLGTELHTIYVARLDRNGKWANCKPCAACASEIELAGRCSLWLDLAFRVFRAGGLFSPSFRLTGKSSSVSLAESCFSSRRIFLGETRSHLQSPSKKMIVLNGYDILAQIYESVNSEVYRAIRTADNQPVMLKILKQEYPTAQELTHYKQEYKTICGLNFEGAIKAYGLETYRRTPVIILEDFGGISLKKWLEGKPLALRDFLSLAPRIVANLEKIHNAKVIHKDINPANIVLNPETGQIKIIDFGIASVLRRENPGLKNPNVLEGTLAYISPEQTGRMNRSLDYRTDFYSLGVSFYELLTGQLPFRAKDALELVHCHLAKQPLEINSLVREKIPPVVEAIIRKLMAKTPEERYQSAYGIRADLEECLRQLEKTAKIEDFVIAGQDLANQFQIPQKLYGREAQLFVGWVSGSVNYAGVGFHASTQPTFI